MSWTIEDTAAYWAEVHREAERDAWLSRRLIDPLSHTYYKIPARESICEAEGEEDWCSLRSSVNVKRALSLLPIVDRSGVFLGGSEEGSNVTAVTRIQRRNRAGHRLALVAPWAMRGWDSRRIIRPVCDRDKPLVQAYLDTWTTTGAAKACGVSQYTAYMRLKKIAETPGGEVIRVIMNRPEISNTKNPKRADRRLR